MSRRTLVAALAAIFATLPTVHAGPFATPVDPMTVQPGPLGVVPPGVNPCTDLSNSYCPPRALDRAGCHAIGVVGRGTLHVNWADSEVLAPAGGPSVSDEAHVSNQINGPVIAQTINSRCTAWAGFPPLPTACAEASVEHVEINLGSTLRIRADAIRNRVCNTLGQATFSQTGNLVEVAVSVLGQNEFVSHGLNQNQRVDLPGVGFIVFNERASGPVGDCFVRTGAGMRIVLFTPQQEIIVSWVSVATCKLRPTVTVESIPSLADGSFFVGTTFRARSTVTHSFGATPAPTGTVGFLLCKPAQVAANGGDCSSGGTQIGNLKLLAGSPPAGLSDPTSDTFAPGTHCWRATYSGDALYVGPASVTGTFTACFKTIFIT